MENRRPRPVDVELTVATRRPELEQIVAARTSGQRLILRARIVSLAAADGMANAAITAELGCSVPTVRTW